MDATRHAAVAGTFYPASRGELELSVAAMLASAAKGGPAPKAIIAPHAGHIYSGPVAASAYARLAPARGRIGRVVLMGPSHRVPFAGLAVCGAEAYETPLGRIPIDGDAMNRLLDLPQVRRFDPAHACEHSLEVHLPFLQKVLGEFTLVPIVAGLAAPHEVAEVLDAVWGGPETLVVISSDLSHYLGYDEARRTDARTARAIEALDPAAIGEDDACGRVPVGGLLALARRRGMKVETVDMRNSGDTAGPRDRVVGYGAWAFTEAADQASAAAGEADAQEAAIRGHGPTLLALAAASIRHGLSSGEPLHVRAADHPPPLCHSGAAFVTLRCGGELRGCVGSSVAWRALVEDVADNAFNAGFRDSRFAPVTESEFAGCALSVAVLTEARPMRFDGQDDLLRQLRPGIDGLIIEDMGRRALFLPAVWRSLPEPQRFLAFLKHKAGLPAEWWSPTFSAKRFTTIDLRAES